MHFINVLGIFVCSRFLISVCKFVSNAFLTSSDTVIVFVMGDIWLLGFVMWTMLANFHMCVIICC